MVPGASGTSCGVADSVAISDAHKVSRMLRMMTFFGDSEYVGRTLDGIFAGGGRPREARD